MYNNSNPIARHQRRGVNITLRMNYAAAHHLGKQLRVGHPMGEVRALKFSDMSRYKIVSPNNV